MNAALNAPLSEPPRSPPADAGDAVAMLADLLVERGQVDARTIDRARRVAAESGQRLDAVLIQLGLVGERSLAECFAALLGIAVASADRFPEEPLLPERLKPKFLRRARAVPVAVERGRLVVAMADPLDTFAIQAVAMATGQKIAVEVAVPIEL